MALSFRDITVGGDRNSLLDTLRGYFVRYRPGAVSFLGSSRCARCCPELELADGRRVTSHRGSPAVRVDDVQVHETRDSQIR